MSRRRARTVVVAVVAVACAGSVTAALGGGGEKVSVATVGDDAVKATVPSPPPQPEAPVTFEGVRARLHCPGPPDPNGPSDIVSVHYDYAAGNGEPTPEQAVRLFVRSTWPAADVASFSATARNSTEVLFENPHAALLVTGAQGGVWTVRYASYCGASAAEWRAGKR